MAFSAVIASLIMMLLAVAAGVVVYAYVMGWIGGAQQNPTQTGKLSFDSITASSSTGIIMYVRNSGSVDVLIDKVYVDGNATVFTQAPINPLVIQSTTKITATQVNIATANFYEVKVVCTDGTTVSTSVQATT